MASNDVSSRGGRKRWWREVLEQAGLAVHLVRWILLGAASGALAGLSSYVFLEGLRRVTDFRVEHGWLLWLLPAAGLLLGLAYHYAGGRAGEGNSLLIEQIHQPTEWVPKRMAPFVLLGTWATHLFGGSAGREGTALQMSGSLTDMLSRVLRLDVDSRRLLLISALAGGFGAVFGVPLAGAVFALEVQAIGRVRYEALVPALAASLVGDLVVSGLGYHHVVRTQFVVDVSVALVGKVALAGLVFGLAGAAFVELTHAIRQLAARIAWPPLRPAIGGAAVVGLAVLFGRDYLGLSLPLIDRALAGDRLSFAVFALKIVFTAVTLGCAFPGGEVTPLFVIGATLGAALAAPLHLPVALLAGIGFVAVFAGAANTPLACTIMGVELFGSAAVVPIAVGCVISYVFSNHRGIYPSQRIHAAKGSALIAGSPSLYVWRHRRHD
ncbi:MAG: chloride channel protein [Actinomycetota bacterium]|nr:chloride channel protein [Actinomycetota bacterium]